MYEFDPRMNPMGMGFWGWVAPAAGVAATGYALYRARRAEQQQQASCQSQARGTIEGPIAAQCRSSQGSACSPQQVGEICNNLSYNMLTDQHWNECRPHISAAHLCQLSDGAPCSTNAIAEFCAIRPAASQPRDCGAFISALEAQQQAAAAMQQQEVQRLQPYTGAKSEAHTGVVTGGGMQGLGFTRVAGGTPCDEVPEGEPFCFRTTTVDGNPPEQRFARNQGCLPLSSGANCNTSPYGNPGSQWCCPPGWPREPGAGPLQPGEFPPAPPGIMNKIQFWGQYWWFWALVAGIPVAGYLGYQFLKDEGYIADYPTLEDTYDPMEEVAIGYGGYGGR